MTISDLARHLGMAESTISKALNNRSDVSEAVKALVSSTAAELGYTPNPAARKLALQSSGTLGIFLLNRFDRPVDSYFGYQFLGGIMKESQIQGLDVLLFSECLELKNAGYLSYCRRKGVEGAIFVGLSPQDSQISALSTGEFPLISIDTPIPGSHRGFITSDNRGGIESLVTHQWNQGAKNLGYLGIRGEGYVAVSRRESFIATAQKLGCYEDKFVLESVLSLEGGREAALMLLSRSSKPEALVCATDLQALGALEAAKELGIRVPQDLKISGFDNIQASAFSHPPLTTYAQDTLAMGSLAVKALRGPIPDSQPHFVPGSLIVRHST